MDGDSMTPRGDPRRRAYHTSCHRTIYFVDFHEAVPVDHVCHCILQCACVVDPSCRRTPRRSLGRGNAVCNFSRCLEDVVNVGAYYVFAGSSFRGCFGLHVSSRHSDGTPNSRYVPLWCLRLPCFWYGAGSTRDSNQPPYCLSVVSSHELVVGTEATLMLYVAESIRAM